MAWTDQCKIAAVQTIDKVAGDMGVSVRRAIDEVSAEADIPSSTLQKWYYPRNKSEATNGPTSKPTTGVESNDNNDAISDRPFSEELKEIADQHFEEHLSEINNQQEGPSRKPKKRNKPAVGDERVTEGFFEAYDKMIWAIKDERDAGWKLMTKQTALRHIDSLLQILTHGE